MSDAAQELLAMMAARERCQLCGFRAETCEKLPRPCCEDCTHSRDANEPVPDLSEVLRWALTTGALGVPHLFNNNPQDSAFVRGHRLACAQILDVIENGWVNRRDPLDIYRDLGLTW